MPEGQMTATVIFWLLETRMTRLMISSCTIVGVPRITVDVEPTDGVSQLQQKVAGRTEPLRAGLVVGTAHHGDEDPQDQANDQRQQGDDDGDLQAVSDVSPTVFFDKVRNKFLLHFCKPSTQMLIPSC